MARYRKTIRPGFLLAAAGVLAFSLCGNAAPAGRSAHAANAPSIAHAAPISPHGSAAVIARPSVAKQHAAAPVRKFHMPNGWTANKPLWAMDMPNRWNGGDPKAMDNMNLAPAPLDPQTQSGGFGAGNNGTVFGK